MFSFHNTIPQICLTSETSEYSCDQNSCFSEVGQDTEDEGESSEDCKCGRDERERGGVAQLVSKVEMREKGEPARSPRLT